MDIDKEFEKWIEDVKIPNPEHVDTKYLIKKWMRLAFNGGSESSMKYINENFYLQRKGQ